MDGGWKGGKVKTLTVWEPDEQTDKRTNRGGWGLNRSINASVVMELILLLLITVQKTDRCVDDSRKNIVKKMRSYLTTVIVNQYQVNSLLITLLI